ncbi:MAG: type II 3-dehydroquinate dehydratase [Polyangiaceae bacterium]
MTKVVKFIPRILCLSGPNLQLLGMREPAIYGSETLPVIHRKLTKLAKELEVEITCIQSNHEGVLCDHIGNMRGQFEGLLLNAAAYTHTSLALYDAIVAVDRPCIEVHLSNPHAREAYRRESKIAPACIGVISGFQGESYLLALRAMTHHLRPPVVPPKRL